MRNAAIILATLSGCISFSQAQPVGLRIGESFLNARAQLHAAGWQPDPQSPASSGEYMGLDRVLIQSGYPEVDYCSVEASFCTLQYVNGKACLRLHTKGEHIRTMTVERWSADCRERQENEPDNVLPADVRYLVQWQEDCESFGQCRGMGAYSRSMRKKYAHDPAVLEIIEAHRSPARTGHASKR